MTLHEGDALVLDLVADLAADAAIGADRMHLAIDSAAAALRQGIDDGLRHESAGGAGLHAFAAGNAGRGSHWVIEIKGRLRADIAKRHADHVIDLNLPA